jgi:hypothetical protein
MWIMASGLFNPLAEPLGFSTLWHLGSPLMIVYYFLILQTVLYMTLAMYVWLAWAAALSCATNAMAKYNPDTQRGWRVL